MGRIKSPSRNPVLALVKIPTGKESFRYPKIQFRRNPVLALVKIPTVALFRP